MLSAGKQSIPGHGGKGAGNHPAFSMGFGDATCVIDFLVE
jgi:hypothetical protein